MLLGTVEIAFCNRRARDEATPLGTLLGCVQDFIDAWNFSPALADEVRKFFIYQISKDSLGAHEEAAIFVQMPRLLQACRRSAHTGPPLVLRLAEGRGRRALTDCRDPQLVRRQGERR